MTKKEIFLKRPPLASRWPRVGALSLGRLPQAAPSVGGAGGVLHPHVAPARLLGGSTCRGSPCRHPIHASAHRARQVLGPPADVYSLGVLVFELLSGEVPFDFDYDANGEAQDSYMGAQGLAGGTSGRGTPARGATEARGG